MLKFQVQQFENYWNVKFQAIREKNGTKKTTWIYQKIRTIFLSKESRKEKKLNCQEIA